MTVTNPFAWPVQDTSSTKAGSLPAKARGKVVEDLALWNHAARIAGGITPQQISAILREADAGYTARLIDLANECRQRDAHLQCVLATSEESIAGLAWQIVPPEKPRAKDKRAAQWVEQVLRETDGLRSLIAYLAGAIYFSFSVNEIIWKKVGGDLVPSHFDPIAPRRFKFRAADGQHVLCDSGQPEVDLYATYPNGKFISSYPRVNGDVRPREGLMRPLIWMSVFRTWAIGDWLKTGEMSWKPWRIGTYKKDETSHEDRDDLEDIMRQMTTDFAAVKPDSTEIDIIWPQGNKTGSGHGEIVTALANEQSKAVLGQTETTQSSSSSGYAQAQTHNEIRKDLCEARARQIAQDITRDLITPMIALNFGTSVKVPRFEFITQDPVDLKAFSEGVKNLKEAGTRIAQVWVREQAGIPEPTEGEEVLGEGMPAAPMGAEGEPMNSEENSGEMQSDPGVSEEHDPKGSIPVLQKGLRMLSGHPVTVSMTNTSDDAMAEEEKPEADDDAAEE